MTERQMWEQYCSEHSISLDTPYEAWEYGSNTPDNLCALTVLGVKTGTASAYNLYELENAPVPCAGSYSIILDSKGQAQCIIKNTSVTVVPFDQVTAEHAASEGEGDRSLEYWRNVHTTFFTGELEGTPYSFSEKIPVVCERFEVVHSYFNVIQDDSGFGVYCQGRKCASFDINLVGKTVNVTLDVLDTESYYFIKELALAKVESLYYGLEVVLS